jgi:hypothetical protein
MHRMSAKKQRRILRGWWKWVPVLAIPFSILFFHAWINLQILRADYVLRELNAEARKLADSLNNTGIKETLHEDPEVLAERAVLLEFVPLQPGQREHILYQPAPRRLHPEDAAFTMARRDGEAAVPAPSTEHDPTAETQSVMAPTITVPAAPVVPDGGVAAPPAAADAVVSSPVTAPVLLEIEDTPEPLQPAATTGAVPGGESASGPAMVKTPVVLDLPDDAFRDEPAGDLERAMDSLESL